ATEQLKDDIEYIQCSIQAKTLALQRMQFMDALRKKIHQGDTDSRMILETFGRIRSLNQRIFEYQQEIREKQQQLIRVRKERFSLSEYNREKLEQVQIMKEKQQQQLASQEDATRKHLLSVLEEEKTVTTTLQNITQNIIFASRVNWAQDPVLKNIVLQLEKNVCLE
ncbi:Centromere protein H, partial [Acanthisitta chloris]